MSCKSQFVLASLVQKPWLRRTFASDSAFRVFDLPLRFSIDEQQLRDHYRNLMAQHHPDKQRHQPAAAAVSDTNTDMQASTITRSYEKLRHKHTRAMHLMELLGHAVDESSSGNVVGQGFLMEIMEAREDIDAIEHGADCELQPLLEENKHRMETLALELDHAVQERDFETATQHTARLQYLNRLEETIREKMDTIK